jgi:hypothetical protein
VSQAEADAPDGDQWVSKRDRHFQLINKSVYDKMVEERANDAPGKQSIQIQNPNPVRFVSEQYSQESESMRSQIIPYDWLIDIKFDL